MNPPSPQCGARSPPSAPHSVGRGGEPPLRLPARRVPWRGGATIPDLDPSFSSVSPKWPTSDLVYYPKVGLLIVGTFHWLVRSSLTLPRHNYSRVCGEIFLTACLCKQSVLMCTPRVYLRDAGRHLERAGVKKTQDPHSASPTTPPSSLCKIDHAHFLIIGILCKLSLFKKLSSENLSKKMFA